MPPRHAYWTILIDNQPTAFRAHDPEELLPTLNRLREKNDSAVMKWFERGQLFDSRDAAREAGMGRGERRWEGPRPDRDQESRSRSDAEFRGGDRERRPRQPEVNEEEERILRAATLHLITKHGMFLVATGARQMSIRGMPVWIITVTLRFDKGVEDYIGDLLYDGEAFTFLTEPSVMDDRARKIANEPERLRRWNEYRRSALHAGEG